MEVVFDTTILVDESRNYRPAVQAIEKVAKKEITGYISRITEGELLSGKDCERETVMKRTLDVLQLFSTIEIDKQVIQTAAEFRRKYDVLLLDCIIAATAFHQKCKLWTKNKKDFERIKEIEVEEPY